MYQLIESIKILDGIAYNLEYHNHRMNTSRKALFGLSVPIHLEEHLTVPEYARQGLFKCRILYSRSIERVEYLPYKKKFIRKLKIVDHDHIQYAYKFADRRELDKLFAQREDCDDILIIKKGLVTDTFIGNIIFFDGARWVTPSQPLLKGTQRHKLLDEKQIVTGEIRKQDIWHFNCFKVINALNDLDAQPAVPVEQIKA